MCQEILTPRLKPTHPNLLWLFVVSSPSLSFSLPLMAFLSLIYTLWLLFSFLSSVSFIQFNDTTSNVGHFLLFFCDTMAAVFFFFFPHAFFLNRYTYKHHCIYASQDLNIQCSELSIDDLFFFFFIYIPISHVIALSWPAVYSTTAHYLDLFRYPISVSHLFLHFAFFSIRSIYFGVLWAPYDIKTFYFAAAARDL